MILSVVWIISFVLLAFSDIAFCELLPKAFQSATILGSTSTEPPPCITSTSQLGYVNTSLSSTKTFLNCLYNIPDAAIFPTYYNNKLNGYTNFSIGLTLNNLIKVDEIEGTVTLSFSVGLSWTDQRFAMPTFWNAVKPTTSIDITNVLQNQNIFGQFFFPQVRYPDATVVNALATDFSLTSKNMFVVKYGIIVTLVQSSFNFQKYPGDTQLIQLRIYIYPFDINTAKMRVYKDGIYFSADSEGADTFKQNQVWSYKSSSASTYNSQGSETKKSIWLGEIYMERQGSGIVIRLILPIFLLLILSVITFWMTTEKRIDVTVTILLSVSALYIVILGNIPLVGYLTSLDKFVFWMFFMLIVVVTLHQIYSTLEEKKEHYPLRIFYIRCIEAFGRVFLLPLIVIYFTNSITFAEGSNASNAIIWTAVALAITVACRELIGIRDKFYKSLDALVKKINHKETTIKDITPIEFFVINIWKFHVLSTSNEYLGELFSNNKRLATDFRPSLSLKSIVRLKKLLKGYKTTDKRTSKNRRSNLNADDIQMIQLATCQKNDDTDLQSITSPIFSQQFKPNQFDQVNVLSNNDRESEFQTIDRKSTISMNATAVDSDDEGIV